jgi:4-hydroxybenzoate polyprenyltransferase
LSESNENIRIPIAKKIFAYFLLTRPAQLIWLDVFVSLAIYAVLARHGPTAHYLLFMACAIISDAGASTINDLGDLESDRRSTEDSRKLRPLPKGYATKKGAIIQALILFIIGLGIALYLSVYVFIFAFLLVFISYQYSMKPLKLNARPIVSQLFWVSFAILYYFAVAVYLIKYDGLEMENFYNGLYFLFTMVLFATLGETLAKDMRDLKNDRAGGKITTPVYFGHKPAAVASFTFSVLGLSTWALAAFTIFSTPFFFKVLVIFVATFWNIICLFLCRSIYFKYTKERARELHLGFILTFTIVLSLTYFIAIL